MTFVGTALSLTALALPKLRLLLPRLLLRSGPPSVRWSQAVVRDRCSPRARLLHSVGQLSPSFAPNAGTVAWQGPTGQTPRCAILVRVLRRPILPRPTRSPVSQATSETAPGASRTPKPSQRPVARRRPAPSVARARPQQPPMRGPYSEGCLEAGGAIPKRAQRSVGCWAMLSAVRPHHQTAPDLTVDDCSGGASKSDLRDTCKTPLQERAQPKSGS